MFALLHVSKHTAGKSRREENHCAIFSTFPIMSSGHVSFYGLIQQLHLRLGFWASQGHSWWNYWDSTPFITAWHVSCSRFCCRKVTAEDSSFFVEQPSKTTSCIYQKKGHPDKSNHKNATLCFPVCPYFNTILW